MEESTTRFRLDLAYDGADFLGWARQREGRTVQGELEGALATLLRSPEAAVRLTVAGRTDSGVHATGQVAHLDLTDRHRSILRSAARPGESEGDALTRKLNGIAGRAGDVVVRSAQLAPEGFDARFSPEWRRYEYRIADATADRDPRTRGWTHWHQRPLDLADMRAAAETLIGLHDWAAYCRPRPEATTIRTLQEFTWDRDPQGVLVTHVQADAFCHSMVRALVGSMIGVGEGALAIDEPRRLRDAGQRTNAIRTAPAAGLTLTKVGYPADDELSDRAVLTRQRRQVTELDT